MNRTRTLVCLMASALLIGAALAQDDLPEWQTPERELEFETGGLVSLRKARAEFKEVRPEYCATFSFVQNAITSGDTMRLTRVRDPERLLSTESARQFSEQQRDFVRRCTWVSGTRSEYKGLSGYPAKQIHTYSVYAVSEEDARLMALAALELLDSEARCNFEQTRGYLGQTRSEIDEVRAELPRAAAELQRCADELAQTSDATGYTNAEPACQDIRELNKVLQLIEIEIAGINARIDAIKSRLSDNGLAKDPDMAMKLERMQVECDIELAGALARRAAAQEQRERVKAFCGALDRYEKAKKHESAAKSRLDLLSATEQDYIGYFAGAPDIITPVAVRGNRVSVREILWP